MNYSNHLLLRTDGVRAGIIRFTTSDMMQTLQILTIPMGLSPAGGKG